VTHDNLSIRAATAASRSSARPPEKLNALHRALWASIPAAVAELDADPGVGSSWSPAGKAFCAGIACDHAPALAAAARSPGAANPAGGQARALYDDVRRYQRTMSCFADTNKPVIAAVHGACIGGGMDLITACDIRLRRGRRDVLGPGDEDRHGRRRRHAAEAAARDRRRSVRASSSSRDATSTRPRCARDRLVNDVLPDVRGAARSGRGQSPPRSAANSAARGAGRQAGARFAVRREVDAALDYVALWNSAFLTRTTSPRP